MIDFAILPIDLVTELQSPHQDGDDGDARRRGLCWRLLPAELRLAHFGRDGSAVQPQPTGRFDIAAALLLVNPNSPTGRHVAAGELQDVLRRAPQRTRVWIDETYVEYAGAGESLERFAAESCNVVICKSMSKVYALSGVRAAYLCASSAIIDSLRPHVPPWAVSLPGQVAAVAALGDPGYYERRLAETHILRDQFAARLRRMGVEEIVPSVGNIVMCHLSADMPTAADLAARCRDQGLYIRDISSMGTSLGDRAVRIAIKDEATNSRMMRILEPLLNGVRGRAGSRDGANPVLVSSS